MARTPYKMKSSPAKGILSDFFKGLGKEETKARQTKQKETNEGGLTNFEKRQAEKAAQRKSGGKSKFQRDTAKSKTKKVNKPRTDVLSKNIRDTSDLTVENRAKLGEKVYPQQESKKEKKTAKKITGALGSKTRKEQYDAKGWKYDDTIKGYNRDGTKIKPKVTKLTSLATGGIHSGGKINTNAANQKKKRSKPTASDIPVGATYRYETPPNEMPPFKKSGFKMKKSPAKNYKKGYYGA